MFIFIHIFSYYFLSYFHFIISMNIFTLIFSSKFSFYCFFPIFMPIFTVLFSCTFSLYYFQAHFYAFFFHFIIPYPFSLYYPHIHFHTSILFTVSTPPNLLTIKDSTPHSGSRLLAPPTQRVKISNPRARVSSEVRLGYKGLG